MNKYKLIGILLIFILIIYRWNTVSIVDNFEVDSEDEVKLPPSKINNFRGKLETNIVELYWTPPEIGMESFKFYTLIVLKDDEPAKFIFPKDSSCKLCKYIMSDLEYNSTYKTLVLATNEVGAGEFSSILEFTPINNKDNSTPIPQNNNVVQNVNCNADGTYTIDKFCRAKKNIVSSYDPISHFNLMNSMSKKLKEFNLDIKIF